MDRESIYGRILYSPKRIPISARKFAIIGVNWTFQGVLNMDRTERILRLLTEAVLMFIVFLALEESGASRTLSFLISIAAVHTMYWTLNGQIFVLAKDLGYSKRSKQYLLAYLETLKLSLAKKPWIRFAAVYGSYARDGISQGSDLDIRIVRKSGAVNALEGFFYIASLRARAFFTRFPLDIFLLDSMSGLNRMKESGVVLLDNREAT